MTNKYNIYLLIVFSNVLRTITPVERGIPKLPPIKVINEMILETFFSMALHLLGREQFMELITVANHKDKGKKTGKSTAELKYPETLTALFKEF